MTQESPEDEAERSAAAEQEAWEIAYAQRQRELDAAVAVFRELGWERAWEGDPLTLPLGSAEQRAVALRGFAEALWDGFPPRRTATARRGDLAGVDHVLLWLYAVRVGIGQRRARELLNAHVLYRERPSGFDRALAGALEERGARFSRTFLRAMVRQDPREWSVLLPVFAEVAARLGVDLGDIPGYLQVWFGRVAWQFGLSPEALRREVADGGVLDETAVRARLPQYLASPAMVDRVAARDAAATVAGAVRRGWMARDQAVEAALDALDRAQKPTHVMPWVGLLLDGLSLTPSELNVHRSRLIPALSLGNGQAIEALFPPLLAAAQAEDAVELVVVGLAARTQKARVAVLKALRGWAPPSEVREELVASVGAWLDGSPSEATVARAVLDAWGGPAVDTPAAMPTRTNESSSSSGYRWDRQPQLWTPAPFDVPEPNAENLDRFLGAARAQAGQLDAVEHERCLAVLNAVAHVDPRAADRFLSAAGERLLSVRAYWWADSPQHARHWAVAVKVHQDAYGEDHGWALRHDEEWAPLPTLRDESVMRFLGRAPFLLSTPSTADLVVEPGDLLERLGELHRAGLPALEDDLLLALTRLRGTADGSVELTAAERRVLEASIVPVQRWNGSLLPSTSADLVSAYLAAPEREPMPAGDPSTERSWPAREESAGVEGFVSRPRLGGFGEVSEGVATFPEWKEATVLAGRVWGDEWAAISARGTGLPAAVASRLFLAASEPLVGAAAHRVALQSAWQRGLLAPGSISLDAVARDDLARYVGGIATAAMALAEVGGGQEAWNVLSHVAERWADSPRPPRGIVELFVALEELLPSAIAAVAGGLVGEQTLTVPAARAIASRTGRSTVVGAAKRFVALLPDAAPSVKDVRAPLDGQEFLRSWGQTPQPAPRDASRVSVLELAFQTHPVVAELEDGRKISFAIGQRFDALEGGRQSAGRLRMESQGFVLSADGSEYGEANVVWVPDQGYELAALEVAPTWQEQETWTETQWAEQVRRWEEHDLDRVEGRPPLPLPRAALAATLLGACRPGEEGRESRDIVAELCDAGCLPTDFVGELMPAVLASLHPAAEGGLLVSSGGRSDAASRLDIGRLAQLAREEGALGALWPVLTSSVAYAATLDGPPPRWLNTVLAIAISRAPVLTEAARKGLMPGDWPGLEELCARPGKHAALAKARALAAALHLGGGIER